MIRTVLIAAYLFTAGSVQAQGSTFREYELVTRTGAVDLPSRITVKGSGSNLKIGGDTEFKFDLVAVEGHRFKVKVRSTVGHHGTGNPGNGDPGGDGSGSNSGEGTHVLSLSFDDTLLNGIWVSDDHETGTVHYRVRLWCCAKLHPDSSQHCVPSDEVAGMSSKGCSGFSPK